MKSAMISTKIPPTIEEVKSYFKQRGISEEEAESFFLFYEIKKWIDKKGNPLKTWKNAAYRWIASAIKSHSEL